MNLTEYLRREDYPALFADIAGMNHPEMVATLRDLYRNDLYALLRYGMGRQDMDLVAHPDWLLARCREVQKNPDGYIDLWAREAFKSSIITMGLTIQTILRGYGDDGDGSEPTICLFSHTRPIAKAFLRQIRSELTNNVVLKELFRDIFYENPSRDSPRWSDEGLVFKRRTNPKEACVEAWGLVDSMPTGMHFTYLIYDDVVTLASVSNAEQIQKTTEAWEMSRNLGSGEDTKTRIIGTRYHFNDTYGQIIKRQAAIPRVYPATDDGTVSGEPVLRSREFLDKRYREMGQYVFSCLPFAAPILMADGTEKRIIDVRVGDLVVGFTSGDVARKGEYRIVPVLAVGKREPAEVWKYVFDDGSFLECTEDHKWYTGRHGERAYAPIGTGYHGTKRVRQMYAPGFCPDDGTAAWLGGIFDGEGAVSGGTLTISQSPEHNPIVCAAIEAAFAKLGFDYGTHERPAYLNNKAGRIYYLRGGVPALIRFLQWCKPVRGYKILDLILGKTRKATRRKLVGRRFVQIAPTYTLQTETGNYIAYGYLSKNSQMLQNPIADSTQGFQRNWLRYFDDVDQSRHMNKYVLVDPASQKKARSDWTAIAVIGLGPDENMYLLDAVRDRLNLTERGAAVMRMHRKWRPKVVGYERYGMQADIEYIREVQKRENYRFDVVEVGGTMPKSDRIRRLIPFFEAGRFYLPDGLFKTIYDKSTVNLIEVLVEEEMMGFPVSLHDDLLDAISRIFDTNMIWPKDVIHEEKKERYVVKKRRSWMA